MRITPIQPFIVLTFAGASENTMADLANRFKSGLNSNDIIAIYTYRTEAEKSRVMTAVILELKKMRRNEAKTQSAKVTRNGSDRNFQIVKQSRATGRREILERNLTEAEAHHACKRRFLHMNTVRTHVFVEEK